MDVNVGRVVVPQQTHTRVEQGLALHQQGLWDGALAIYQEVLQTEPGQFNCLRFSGHIAAQRGELGLGVTLIRDAIRQNAGHPDLPATYVDLAGMLRQLSRPKEALESLDAAIALQPTYAVAHKDRGHLLRELRQHDDALISLDTAIRLQPDYAEAFFHRANVLSDLARYEEALESAERAVALAPSHGVAHNMRGAILGSLGRLADAMASFEEALRLQPDFAEAVYNRGQVFYRRDALDAALTCFDRAVTLDPSHALAHTYRGVVLNRFGKVDDALASLYAAVACSSGDMTAIQLRSLVLLKSGNFIHGWRDYESRFKDLEHFPPRNLAASQWDGYATLAGKTILLHGEQGFGDQIQFCRYAPLVKALGAYVLVEVDEALVPLVRTLAGVDKVVARGDVLPPLDFHCSLMSLPFALKTDVATIPAAIPYLYPSAEKVAAWTKRLGPKRRLRVGLVWNGGHRPGQPEVSGENARRNVSFDHIARLNIPGIDFFSLQKGELAEAALAEERPRYWPDDNFFNFTDDLHDFSDTAALMATLDLVISVDTACAHLAGALGKPVWVLDRFDNCWRWMTGRDDSPWYPTMRFYRQPSLGDWDDVLRRVRHDLMMQGATTAGGLSP